MLYLCLVVFCLSIFCDFLLYKKIKQLLILDKRQQSYIKALIAYNTKMIILQKLFYCITLINDQNTKEIGQKKLKRNFQLPDNFDVNTQNLITQFEKMLKTEEFNFMIKDGKYIIR